MQSSFSDRTKADVDRDEITSAKFRRQNDHHVVGSTRMAIELVDNNVALLTASESTVAIRYIFKASGNVFCLKARTLLGDGIEDTFPRACNRCFMLCPFMLGRFQLPHH